MNTLRMSFLCSASRIKHRIGLLTLLLLWPAFASATCSPTEVCVVTSGTAISNGPFNFAGKGFSASGLFDFGASTNVFHPYDVGDFYEAQLQGGTDTAFLLQFELTVKGVPWGIPNGGFAELLFFGFPVLYPVGQSSAPFSFDGSFKGAPEPFAPGLGCDVLNCKTLNFRGLGTVIVDVLPWEDTPFVQVIQETYTFGALPEPATLSLFAIGLIGLAMRGHIRCRRGVICGNSYQRNSDKKCE
jgi:PEP-CTERM motif